ncbi:DUF4118 domain-containing protein [Aquincola sp. S2]|uniref:histidine kinase n=1 Tax=Pseudaquabacterium terrae TaxID=2732868 RepID=A0ABX2EFR5_9BURK|nr:ATP-binding protein [Aquabacterium terrae]NRF67435.1 DUF4118 domain-containing protein [Aquabacterium terrae]
MNPDSLREPTAPPWQSPRPQVRSLALDLAAAGAVWALAWAAMLALDGRVDLSNLAMLLVLASALASLWLPVPLALAGSALAVVAFNWVFVPPRGSFAVAGQHHALLLGGMLGVSAIVAALIGLQRRRAADALQHRRRAEQLRDWGDALRDAAEPLAHGAGLQAALSTLAGAPAALLLLKAALPRGNDDDAAMQLGAPDADQRAGLWHCLRQGQAMGPGTGRHHELPAWYLPLRGRGAAFGAALLPLPGSLPPDAELQRQHAQALCDQLGLALQRVQIHAAERAAQDQAHLQAVRNALLAAISHDFRTPLASILGAASSLQEQDARLDAAQRRRLADRIVDEAGRLRRLADNTLQLARLDAPGLELQRDWESAEEIVGDVLRRARARDPSRRLNARLEPGLPLLRCDALLITQLLDNLVDNALKYSPPDAPVEILVRRLEQRVLLAVRDRGPGIAPSWRERIFDVFQRGDGSAALADAAAQPGAGVGLAVCRAIARAHGGELRLRPRGHGGTSFELSLAVESPPE